MYHQEECIQERVSFLDINQYLSINHLSRDKLHLNQRGKQTLAHNILKLLVPNVWRSYHDKVMKQSAIRKQPQVQAKWHKSRNSVHTSDPVINSELKIVHLNVRSVTNKRNALINFIDSNDPDVLVLTEHWLSEEEIENLTIPNHQLCILL